MNSNLKIKEHQRIKLRIINLDSILKSNNQNYQERYYIELMTI